MRDTAHPAKADRARPSGAPRRTAAAAPARRAATLGNGTLQRWLRASPGAAPLRDAQAMGALRRQLVTAARHDPLEAQARSTAAGGAGRPLSAAAPGAPAPPLPAPVAAAIASPSRALRQDERASAPQGAGVEAHVHTGEAAARAAAALGARAFTVGAHIVLGRGEGVAGSLAGRRLLAHELAHVAQQRGTAPRVQADLKAYNSEVTEDLPGTGDGLSFSSISKSAEAPALRAALADLIAADKVREVQSGNGVISWFSAQHHKNCQLAEIEDALTAAGYAKAGKLARAIYDIHGEYVYTEREMSTTTMFWTTRTPLGKKVQAQAERSMTEWEIRQARRVFGNAIDYGAVTLADGSPAALLGSLGGYARTVGNTIYLPDGRSRDMLLLIHELTHVWQYQTIGAVYAPKALAAQATEGYEYADDYLTNDETLVEARKKGKTLQDYNLEQQGDILRDYYRALTREGEDPGPWQPFVEDIPGR